MELPFEVIDAVLIIIAAFLAYKKDCSLYPYVILAAVAFKILEKNKNKNVSVKED